jgi:hypothetical protein
MRLFWYILSSIYLSFLCCSQDRKTTTKVKSKTETNIKQSSDKELEELEKIVYKVFVWSDTTRIVVLAPLIGDSSRRPIGFDSSQIKSNINAFIDSDLFSNDFIENYMRIIEEIDFKIRNSKYTNVDWYIDELPVFKFASGWNPWCCCQCECSKDNYEVIVDELVADKCIIRIKRGSTSSWIDFTIKLQKEKGFWKVTYMEGFDYEEAIK